MLKRHSHISRRPCILQLWTSLFLLIGLAGNTFDRETEPDPTQYKTITVLTYNVLHHTDRFVDDLNSPTRDTPIPSDRIAPTLELLSRQNVDIIALQEVTPELLAAIQNHAGLAAFQVASTLPPVEDGWQLHLALAERYLLGQQPWGQAILSKWPITEMHIYPMGRPLLVTRIAIDDLTLTVATCHLDSLEENHQMRVWQLQQAFRQLDSASDALLLGDFNFGDDGSEQSALNFTYKDVWRQLKPDDPGYTYDGVTNPLAYGGVPARRLDRILVRSDKLEPVAVMLIGQERVEHKGKSLYLSDHFGVIAHLRRTVR